MIIRGGEYLYPREIEEFLYQMEGIKDVQVAGIPSKKYGEAVGAFIILHEGVEMNEFDIRDFCDGKIARYKIPKYISFVDEFPMTGQRKEYRNSKLKDVGLELCREQGIEILFNLQPASCIKNAEFKLHSHGEEVRVARILLCGSVYRISELDSRCTPQDGP